MKKKAALKKDSAKSKAQKDNRKAPLWSKKKTASVKTSAASKKPTVKKSRIVAKKATTTAKKSRAVAKKTTTTAKKTGTVAKKATVAAKKKKTAVAKRRTTVKKPKPVEKKTKTTVAKAKPVVIKKRTATAKPKPVVKKRKTSAATKKPAAKKTKDTVAKRRTTVKKPKPVEKKTKTTVAKAKPVVKKKKTAAVEPAGRLAAKAVRKTPPSDARPKKAPKKKTTEAPAARQKKAKVVTPVKREKVPSAGKTLEGKGKKRPREALSAPASESAVQESIFLHDKKGLPSSQKKEALFEKGSPEGEEKEPMSWKEQPLPSEYGENSITLMLVNPRRVFTFWELREDALGLFQGHLNLRINDVTGIDPAVTYDVPFLDIPVDERIGSRYLDVSPGMEYITEIGIVYKNVFISIVKSSRVSTPRDTAGGTDESLEGASEESLLLGYDQ
jgi:hypothetical protein